MRAFFFLICVVLTSAFPNPIIYLASDADDSLETNSILLPEDCRREMADAYDKTFWVPLSQTNNRTAILHKLMEIFDFNKCKDVPIYINIVTNKPKKPDMDDSDKESENYEESDVVNSDKYGSDKVNSDKYGSDKDDCDNSHFVDDMDESDSSVASTS